MSPEGTESHFGQKSGIKWKLGVSNDPPILWDVRGVKRGEVMQGATGVYCNNLLNHKTANLFLNILEPFLTKNWLRSSISQACFGRLVGPALW